MHGPCTAFFLLLLLFTASLLGGSNLRAAGTPTFDTVNGVAIGGGANTITLGKGTTTVTLNSTGTLGSNAFTSTAYVPQTFTINGHALTGNVTLVKSDLSLGSVENTALSTWAGSTALTTLGTIGTGTWQGSIIGPTYLGTGTGITTKFLRGDGTWQTVDTTITANSTATSGFTNGQALISDGTTVQALTLGTLATQSGTFSGTSSGTNTGDQTITLTGGVTGSGTGSFAATVVTNANLTGPITSVGNATSIASQTGTGTKFVVDTAPTIVTPFIAAINGGANANDGITVQGTTNSTRTTSYVLLQPSGGKVGIGTSAPNVLLHAYAIGNASATITAEASADFGAVLRTKNSVKSYQAGLSSAFAESWAVYDETANASRFRIHSSGGISINNATDPGAGNLSVTGTGAFSGTVTGSNLSGTNTGDQTITLTGGVTGSGTGSFAATVVTNANLTGDVTSVGNATTLANIPAISGANLTSLTAANITASTTVGRNLLNLTNPSAVTWNRVNADNTVSSRTAAQTLADIGGIDGTALNASNLTSGNVPDARNTVSNSTTTTLSALGTIGGLTTVTGTGAMSLTGGAGNWTQTAGTGNSRTMAFRTTTSGGTATTALTLGADQSATFGGNIAFGGTTNTIGDSTNWVGTITLNSLNLHDSAASSISSSTFGVLFNTSACIFPNSSGTPDIGLSSPLREWRNLYIQKVVSSSTTDSSSTTTGAVTLAGGIGIVKNANIGGTVTVTGASTLTGAVGVGGTANANAILDAQSTTKAFMPPRMTTTQKNAIALPTAGMVVYDSTLGKLSVYTGSVWETVTSL